MLADAAQWLRPAVRLLLLLTGVLILVMPLTESLWNWDHFLRGGSDVEFTLLATLLFAGLVLLAMERSLMQPLAAVLLHAGLLLRDRIIQGRDGLGAWRPAGDARLHRLFECVMTSGAGPQAMAPLRI